jgi:hypothetical protein
MISTTFGREGETRTAWTEKVRSQGDNLSPIWSDFTEPFVLTLAAGSVAGRPHGVYSCFIPARGARVALNGRVAAGRSFPQ